MRKVKFLPKLLLVGVLWSWLLRNSMTILTSKKGFFPEVLLFWMSFKKITHINTKHGSDKKFFKNSVNVFFITFGLLMFTSFFSL